jgi:hypothetical protein
MGRIRRRVLSGLAVLCAAGTVAACASTVNGSGTVGSRSNSASPTGLPSGSPSTPSSSAAQGDLASFLISAPAGSQHGSSSWATTTSPTITQFVQHFYDADQVSAEVTRLQGDGITDVAHVLWLDHGEQYDVILLRFDNAGGALTRHTGIVAATRSDSTLRSTTPTIPGDVTEFYTATVDKLGNIASRAYALKGDITVEVFGFSPKTFDGAGLTRYTGQQVAKLP